MTAGKLITLVFSLLALADLQAAETTDPALTSTTPANKVTLEKAFSETLRNAEFVGRWCLVEAGQLTPAKEEKYTIHSATKLVGDNWLINARIQFGDRDVTVPVPVKVKWAGDTPVITVSKLGIPGIGTYSARVLVYDHTYAGTWSGPDHGGLLNGVIVQRDTQPPQATPPDSP